MNVSIMPLYRLRVDNTSDLVLKGLNRLIATSKDHVLVSHVLPEGRNPHYHMFIDSPYKSSPAIRSGIDVFCAVSGADRSVKTCDGDRIDDYIQYLFNEKHGNKWELISSSIDTTEHQRKAKTVATEFDEVQQQREKKKDKKGLKPTQWSMAKEVWAIFSTERLRLPSPDTQVLYDLTRVAIRVCRSHGVGICDYSLQKIVQTAMIQEGSPYADMVVNATVNRMIPRRISDI